MVFQKEILLPSFERGFHLITRYIEKELPELPDEGLVNLFIHHTSAGLTINENADPTVRVDLEASFSKLVPDSISTYVHNSEGPDDMPAHIKSSVVGHSLVIPISGSMMKLGIWQGIYLCEFRNRGGRRRVTITVYS